MLPLVEASTLSPATPPVRSQARNAMASLIAPVKPARPGRGSIGIADTSARARTVWPFQFTAIELFDENAAAAQKLSV